MRPLSALMLIALLAIIAAGCQKRESGSTQHTVLGSPYTILLNGQRTYSHNRQVSTFNNFQNIDLADTQITITYFNDEEIHLGSERLLYLRTTGSDSVLMYVSPNNDFSKQTQVTFHRLADKVDIFTFIQFDKGNTQDKFSSW